MDTTLDDINISDEKALILQAQNDPAGFEPLYNKYFEKIFTFVLYRIHNIDTAADITSKVFMKALLHINKFTFRGLPLSSWLFRIAVNECNEYFRVQKKQSFVILDEQVVQSLGIESDDDREEWYAKLENCIQQLSKEEVELIHLRFFESRSFREVGEILDVTENHAKVKIYRLLGKLRKQMIG